MTFLELDSSLPLRACRNDRGFSSYSPRHSPRRLVLLAVAATLMATGISAASSWAAIVSLKEPEMDAIFGQASFGANPIDVRYLPTITLVDASLLNIDTSSKLFSLFGQFNSSTIHYAYFVDTISWCGGPIPGAVGCASVPGNDFVVTSSFAASANGAELLAHELAHNLSLPHDGAPNNDNLMDPSINSNTTLTMAQASTILSRPSVQTDVSGRFIQIQPVLVVATLVPEPSTMLLSLALIGLVVCSGRRELRGASFSWPYL